MSLTKNIVAVEVKTFLDKNLASLSMQAAHEPLMPPAPKAQTTKTKQTKPAAKPLVKPISPLKSLPPHLSAAIGQAGYDLIWELAPGKILLVKTDNGIYSGYLYDVKLEYWVPLQQITSKELRDLLESGKAPASYKPN